MMKRMVRGTGSGVALIVALSIAGCGGGGGGGDGGAGAGATPTAQGVDAFVLAVDAVIATPNADDVEPQSTATATPTQDDTSEPNSVRTN